MRPLHDEHHGTKACNDAAARLHLGGPLPLVCPPAAAPACALQPLRAGAARGGSRRCGAPRAVRFQGGSAARGVRADVSAGASGRWKRPFEFPILAGCAMGLSLTQIVLLLAIMLPRGVGPSRATVGRWVRQA